MIVTTTFDVPGYKVTQHLGIVRGIIVRAPTIGQGILGRLKSMVGGRIGAYTEMCEQARSEAYTQLVMHAQAIGADAIVGVRYDASDVGGQIHATEVLCYGTAVKTERIMSA
ncbi:MAG: YbjQ family protein [Phycisphaerales bacterium]|nr:YbjQ family protein [Phycisphaerales bacterium]